MALTFTVSNLVRNVVGNKRMNTGTITTSGTTTDNGDALSASSLGLAVVDSCLLYPGIDSTSNPENSFVGVYIPSTGKVVLFTAHGTPGPTVPLIAVTDGTTVAYIFEFVAIGR